MGFLTLRIVLPLVLITLVLSACGTVPSSRESIIGKVTKVHDGDSIHLTPVGQKRVVIRLAGIDAPELKQPFGVASRDLLRSLILERTAEARCHKVDQYRRQVCVVYFEGEDVNLQMIRAGLAWHYKAYEQEQSRRDRRSYAKAQALAQRERVAIWSEASLAPWEFRKQN